MKKKIILVVSIVMIAALTACLNCSNQNSPEIESLSTALSAPKELKVFMYADYINPEIVKDFELRNNCKIIMDYFDSNESMYAKIKAGAAGYDMYICTSYMIKLMFEQKMIQQLDHSKIPNFINVDTEYLQIALDKNMDHSVPYMTSFAGIAYNAEKVKDFKPSWKMFERADLKKRMTLLNDHREVIGAALKTLGFNLNSKNEKELEAAKQLVIKWKKNIAKFDVDEAKRGLTAGEFYLIHAYNGDALQFMKENPKLAFAAPEEGTTLSCDDMVIPAGAKNMELAYKFIDFLLEPEVCAKNMEFVNYLSPNTPAKLRMPKEFIENPAVWPKPEILNKSNIIEDIGDANPMYSRIWDEIKEAK